MENRRPITEADLRETEAYIARSCSRLKRSVVRAPSRALGSVGNTAREHPLAAAAAAIVAGMTLYGLFRLVTRRSPSAARREERPAPDMATELLKMAIPLVAPYIAGYLERYLGRVVSGDRQ